MAYIRELVVGVGGGAFASMYSIWAKGLWISIFASLRVVVMWEFVHCMCMWAVSPFGDAPGCRRKEHAVSSDSAGVRLLFCWMR